MIKAGIWLCCLTSAEARMMAVVGVCWFLAVAAAIGAYAVWSLR